MTASTATMAREGWTTASTSGALSPEELVEFKRLGYLALKNWASADECARMIARAKQIVRDFDHERHASVFSTTDQKRTTDAYFLESGNAVSCFFEEKALDASGRLVVEKEVSINKIGHALHDLDETFRAFSRSDKVEALMRSLELENATPVQSMYIFKNPSIGGEVVPHQDSTFLNTNPPTCVGIWLALEDCTLENGCLWALPGTPPVTRFMTVDFPGGTRAIEFTGESPTYDLDSANPLEVPAGTLVLLHGANVHFSRANTSTKSRHAYSVHFVDGRAEWLPTNWLQRAAHFPFTPL